MTSRLATTMTVSMTTVSMVTVSMTTGSEKTVSQKAGSLTTQSRLMTTIVGLEGRRDPTTCRAAMARVSPEVVAEWPAEPRAVGWAPCERRSETGFAEPAASCARSTTELLRHPGGLARGHAKPWADLARVLPSRPVGDYARGEWQ